MVVSALCSRQLSAFRAYLVYLVCKIHRPDHGSGYSHLLELLRIQKHKISPVIGVSKVSSDWKCRRMASNSTHAVATDVPKAADPDAAVLHLRTGDSYVDCICSSITQVQAGNSTSDRSQLTCNSGEIWRGGVAGKIWKPGDNPTTNSNTVTLKTRVFRGPRELLIHVCGAV